VITGAVVVPGKVDITLTDVDVTHIHRLRRVGAVHNVTVDARDTIALRVLALRLTETGGARPRSDLRRDERRRQARRLRNGSCPCPILLHGLP